MARSKKRSKSLFELMDPGKDYRATIGPGWTSPEPGEPEAAKEEAPVVSEVQPEKKIRAKAVVKEKKIVVKEAVEEHGEQDAAAEPMLEIGDGKVRVSLDYPLAGLICFVFVVLLICALLIGWKFGRDSAFKEKNWTTPTPSSNTGPQR